MTSYKYPEEFILNIIQFYLTGDYSFEKLGRKFQIQKKASYDCRYE